jgi:signal transduction histidine kinase
MSAVSRAGTRNTRSPAGRRSATVSGVLLRLSLEPTPAAPFKARVAVDELAPVLAPGVLDDLRLVISELVSNAVMHGPGSRPIEIELEARAAGRVRGQVVDRGDGVVAIRESADEGGGFGLRLLDDLADRWGVHHGSTHVWFELGPR